MSQEQKSQQPTPPNPPAQNDRATELSRAYEELQRRADAFQRELAMARKVQATFIPHEKDFPKRPELSFAGYYEAMADVGGDLYDIVRIGKNAYGLIIADVSGHGVAAALVTALVKIAFRSRIAYGVSTDELCRSVNAAIYEILGGGERYVTAFVATLNLETGMLEYTNAAHHPAILVRHGLGMKLDSDGSFMGIFETPNFSKASIQLIPGDRLIMYTDGIVESRNFMGDEYGLERLESVVKVISAVQPAEVVSSLVSDMDNFTMGAPSHDDRAFLCMSYYSLAHEPKQDACKETAGTAELSEPDEGRSAFAQCASHAATLSDHEALAAWNEHVNRHPDDHRALNNRGVLLHRLGRNEEALASFRKALILSPGDRRILRNLALVSPDRQEL
ncbi:MAG TPA: SpoIIE family protein phosphatase [Spirochaetales bacterium]|nr:SpoIIE family protein phosphatase [Spirochaetales bacterium]